MRYTGLHAVAPQPSRTHPRARSACLKLRAEVERRLKAAADASAIGPCLYARLGLAPPTPPSGLPSAGTGGWVEPWTDTEVSPLAFGAEGLLQARPFFYVWSPPSSRDSRALQGSALPAVISVLLLMVVCACVGSLFFLRAACSRCGERSWRGQKSSTPTSLAATPTSFSFCRFGLSASALFPAHFSP